VKGLLRSVATPPEDEIVTTPKLHRTSIAALALAAGLAIGAGALSGAVVTGRSKADVLKGTAAADRIRGGGGNDTILGFAGADRIFGEAGNDRILGGAGNDQLSGGARNDILAGEGGNDRVFGDAGNDTLFGNQGNDRLDGGAGVDAIAGSAGNDTILGGGGTDVILGGDGVDRVDGGTGNDLIDSYDLLKEAPACGAGVDLILADTLDVGTGCEAIDRSDDAKRVVVVGFAARNWQKTQLAFPPVWAKPGETLACGSDTDELWAFLMYRGIKKGDRALVTWRVDGDIFNSVETPIPNSGTGVESVFTKFQDGQPLPNGLWDIEIAIGGKILDRNGFRRAC
jgi:Ca2+-binding RTX toxin-like protein